MLKEYLDLTDVLDAVYFELLEEHKKRNGEPSIENLEEPLILEVDNDNDGGRGREAWFAYSGFAQIQGDKKYLIGRGNCLEGGYMSRIYLGDIRVTPYIEGKSFRETVKEASRWYGCSVGLEQSVIVGSRKGEISFPENELLKKINREELKKEITKTIRPGGYSKEVIEILSRTIWNALN